VLSVDRINSVVEFDVKFIHKLGDRQKSATLGTTDKELTCYRHWRRKTQDKDKSAKLWAFLVSKTASINSKVASVALHRFL
jgi:hypothetical protein